MLAVRQLNRAGMMARHAMHHRTPRARPYRRLPAVLFAQFSGVLPDATGASQVPPTFSRGLGDLAQRRFWQGIGVVTGYAGKVAGAAQSKLLRATRYAAQRAGETVDQSSQPTCTETKMLLGVFRPRREVNRVFQSDDDSQSQGFLSLQNTRRARVLLSEWTVRILGRQER